MGLYNCPDCGREISDAAPHCIHCGRPAPPQPEEPIKSHPQPKPGTIPGILGALLLIAGFYALVTHHPATAAVLLAGGLVLSAFGALRRRLRQYRQ